MYNEAPTATIMVVDDIPANLKLLEEMLQRQGYRVMQFPRGAMALKAATKNPPDLILLDVMMPEMDGFEVCQRLKADESLKDIPVLFISALDDTDSKLKAFSKGGLDYVTKPFQEAEVLARVKTHLDLRRMRKELESNNHKLREIMEQKEQQRKALEEELQWAGEMQKVLLKPRITDSERVKFLVSYRPVTSLYCGGDYYDVIYLSKDRYFLLLGDVSGHGVKAALITGILKAIIYPEYVKEALTRDLSPADFLSWLNDRMHFELRNTTGVFLTFLAGVLDLEKKTFRYANAGQNYPIMIRKNENKELAISGPGIGVFSPINYREETVDIQPGDVLNLFTDGLTELDCPEGKKTLDASTIFEAIQDAENYHNRILRKALDTSGASDFTDDITLLTAMIR